MVSVVLVDIVKSLWGRIPSARELTGTRPERCERFPANDRATPRVVAAEVGGYPLAGVAVTPYNYMLCLARIH